MPFTLNKHWMHWRTEIATVGYITPTNIFNGGQRNRRYKSRRKGLQTPPSGTVCRYVVADNAATYFFLKKEEINPTVASYVHH